MKRLLVLSNGAGEDAIAYRILKQLPSELESRVLCCPLVGPGRALAEEFELCGPRVMPPSEGLFRESWRLALADLLSGVVLRHVGQLQSLWQLREESALTVAVGDLFPVLWAALAGHRNILFVGTAKSVYHHPYSWFERAILKRSTLHCLVRDEPTAQSLRSSGVSAEWLGNAMMDEVQPRGLSLPFEKGPLVALLPGSRSQAPLVLPFQLDVVSQLRQWHESLQAGVALAPGTLVEPLCAPALDQGWEFQPPRPLATPAVSKEIWLGTLVRDDCRVELLQGGLGDLLHTSVVALGQAGTANEQAAGAGVPVVAYDPSGGRRLRWYRKRQKGLLGDAVAVVEERVGAVVEELHRLLIDPAERHRRAEIGRERLGPPGGTQAMAQRITDLWWSSQG